MSKKDAYKQKVQARLNEWKADIDKIKARVDRAEADSKIQYYKIVDDLKKKMKTARKKLNELEKAGEDAWEDLRSGVEKATDNLKSSIQQARKKLKD